MQTEPNLIYVRMVMVGLIEKSTALLIRNCKNNFVPDILYYCLNH